LKLIFEIEIDILYVSHCFVVRSLEGIQAYKKLQGPFPPARPISAGPQL